jgi:acyl carrier protein
VARLDDPGDSMSSVDIEKQVIAILAEKAMLSAGDVTLQDTLETLGIDSLGLVEAIFSIEEAFDISIPFNANDPSATEFDISSVQSIVSAVAKLIEDQKT